MSCGLRVDALLGVWTIRGKFMGEPRDASTLLIRSRGRFLSITSSFVAGRTALVVRLKARTELEAIALVRSAAEKVVEQTTALGLADPVILHVEIRSRDAEVIRRKLALAGIALEVETSASGGAA